MHPETPTRFLPATGTMPHARATDLRELHPAEAVPEHFAVAPAVLEAVDRWINVRLVHVTDMEETFLQCPCKARVIPLTRSGVPWRYTDDEKRGLVLAHMVQSHGWSREYVGEQ